MDLTIAYDTKGSAVAGIDRNALIANIQAEVDKFSTQVGTKTVPATQKPAPPGAQGDSSITEWVMKVAADPAMVKTYIQILVFAINELVSAAKTKERGAEKKASSTSKEADDKPVKISILGKQILLPATQAVIKALIDNIKDQ
ncbi:MAG: hypothetical protein QOG67_519 [Verrucomicrobiota bacterium]|jgi:hypothetical protein